MGKCGNWGRSRRRRRQWHHRSQSPCHTLRLNEDNPICYVATTVPETAGSQRRRGSTDFIMHFHRLGAGEASLGSSSQSSAML